MLEAPAGALLVLLPSSEPPSRSRGRLTAAAVVASKEDSSARLLPAIA